MTMKHYMFKISMAITVMLSMVQMLKSQCTAADPWRDLQDLLGGSKPLASKKIDSKEDPWSRLQAIYLPFTVEEETSAVADPKTGRKISNYLHTRLKPYLKWIHEAGHRFNIPSEIIGAVIMVESGGNPRAKAKTSSARGLMQTISATFKEAKNHLKSLGIRVKNSPYDPHASIMAGSWYLDRMFHRAASDKKGNSRIRKHFGAWKYPLEYYYAGPKNGKKKENTVIMYAGGRRVVIDKPAYSKKVLKWAEIMKNS